MTGVEGSPVWNFNLELQKQVVARAEANDANERGKRKTVEDAKKKGNELSADHHQILDADLETLDIIYREDAGRSFFLPPYCEVRFLLAQASLFRC